MLVPADTPEGKHLFVVRIYGQDIIGGVVEYEFPIQLVKK